MKSITSLLMFFFLAGYYCAQNGQGSQLENYILVKTYIAKNNDTVAKPPLINVQYFDGLGRPKQIISVKASPSQKDVVVHIEYDQWGRQVKDYLPVPQSGTQNGQIYTSPLANAPSVYGSEKIYAEKILEQSPLGRVLQQKQVGNDWSNHPVVFGYAANSAAEVKKYTTSTAWANNATSSTLTISGTYGANQLYKNTVTDEDGNISIEFKNGQGQTVLIRKHDGSQNVDTYYVYNEYDQLAFVISPLAAAKASLTSTDLNELCYQYRYDGRNRLVEKKLPGKGWEWMVYDQQDRLTAAKDAQNEWMFTKYDQFGRVVYTGLSNLGNSRQTVQQSLDNLTGMAAANNETSHAVGFHHSNMLLYYNNSVFPTSFSKILSVNYYDKYPPGTPAIPAAVLTQTVLTQDAQNSNISTKSLPTASYVKNIEDDNWTKSYTWYDTKGRPIGSHSINHLGGQTRTESELDFAGAVKQSKTFHKRLNSDTETVITENFTYDHQNRLLSQTHQVNSNAPETLAVNSYNELSQLQQKVVGGTLQTVDYSYNIRGWMTGINDPNNLGGDLFGYKIKYNTVEGLSAPDSADPSLQVIPRFNGNISEVDWKTSLWQNEPLERYGYVYDPLNRLSAGFYQKSGNPSARSYFEKVTYDPNGNISTLKRTANSYGPSAMLIDNLSYQYSNGNGSNRLQKITELAQNYSGYPYSATPTDIAYDINGNMTSFADKGISAISYNFLNLPNQISAQGINTNYLYRADGTKLKKIFYYWETHYLDGFQHRSTFPSEVDGYIDDTQIPEIKLRIIPTAEGYYDALTNNYFYNFVDHLGNIRLTYSDADNNGTVAGNTKVQNCWGTAPEIYCYDYIISGEITLVNNYYPFGLQHEYQYNYDSAYQYKYNGKELQETGMYDYGARFYMQDIGRWGVSDGKGELYLSKSPYSYANNTPVNAIDPDGNLVIFINGMHTGEGGSSKYWTDYNTLIGHMQVAGGDWTPMYKRFDMSVMHRLQDYNAIYRDGALGGAFTLPVSGSPVSGSRLVAGITQGKKDAAEIIRNLARDETTGAIVETIKIITHSMGGAYGKGYVLALKEYISTLPKEQQSQIKISFEADFAPFQPNKQRAVDGVNTFQFSHSDDIVAGDKEMDGASNQDTSSDKEQGHSIFDFFEQIQNLPAGTYKVVNGKIIPQN